MKLIHRFGYYLGGFSLGLIFLAFFLSGKRASCAYGPNARTVKNISVKKQQYSQEALQNMRAFQMDTLEVAQFISSGDVNFSKSITKGDSCHSYLIENEFKDQDLELWVRNCDSIATVEWLALRKED